MANFLRLRRQPDAPRVLDKTTTVYLDDQGVLQQIDEAGDVSPLASGPGSTPTLAEVLAEGADADGSSISSVDNLEVNTINGEAAGGGSQPGVWLAPVVVATPYTDNPIDPLTGGLLVIDGYQTVDGDRVLVSEDANSDDVLTNGIWIARAGPWERASDAQLGAVVAGLYVTTGFQGAVFDEVTLRISLDAGPIGANWVTLEAAFVNGMLAPPSTLSLPAQAYTAVAPFGKPIDMTGHPILNLPTADPHIVGALWNDGGAPAISTG